MARSLGHWQSNLWDDSSGWLQDYLSEECIAVSYARLLLHDTSLKDHQYRLGLEDTRLCECGQCIEDDLNVQGTRTVDIGWSKQLKMYGLTPVARDYLVGLSHCFYSAVIVECFYKSSVSWYINGHFYIHQTDWTSSLNLTDILWIVQAVVHLSLQISSSWFNCTWYLNYFIFMENPKKYISATWLYSVDFYLWYFDMWTLQFYDSALWWWQLQNWYVRHTCMRVCKWKRLSSTF